MSRLRGQRSLVLLALGLVALAAFLPAAAASLAAAVLVPLWLPIPPAVVGLLRRKSSAAREQPASLLSLAAPRGPPSPRAVA
jgi:hypothetical protein